MTPPPSSPPLPAIPTPSDLPPLLELALVMLPVRDLASFAVTSKAAHVLVFHPTSSDVVVWKPLFLRDWVKPLRVMSYDPKHYLHQYWSHTRDSASRKLDTACRAFARLKGIERDAAERRDEANGVSRYFDRM